MPYRSHFLPADSVIGHLTGVVAGTADPALRGQYAGFAAVSAVTVYELAITSIFVDFAEKKHRVFGNYVAASLERVNGRIKLRNLREEHLDKYGPKYRKRFDSMVKNADKAALTTLGSSITQSYGNLITWRHEFAHEGRAPTNATFNDVANAYQLGKRVIDCLAATMVR